MRLLLLCDMVVRREYIYTITEDDIKLYVARYLFNKTTNLIITNA